MYYVPPTPWLKQPWVKNSPLIAIKFNIKSHDMNAQGPGLGLVTTDAMVRWFK